MHSNSLFQIFSYNLVIFRYFPKSFVPLQPIMKKTILYMILPVAALMAASELIRTPLHQGMRLPDSMQTINTTVPIALPDSAIQYELKYYLDRHNVQDEGYEMVVAFVNGQRHQTVVSPHIPTRNIGTWRGYRREGSVVVLDSLKRTIVATCQNDTLVNGLRPDTLGLYAGDFHGTDAEGHGAYFDGNGSYFEGHWEGDRRQGFGLELYRPMNDMPRLRVGQWNNSKFQGERMRYTSERIYGIDIARYQHEKGRRRFPIHWDKLRIINVGKRGAQNVQGTADYPVSFIYIKSTEGKSVRNKYYVSDYAQAKKHGINVGAYHFFSTRTTGIEQAKHFIRNTLFRAGDLPPVLDIEPSDAQIRQIGGPEALFRHIRVWLSSVERWTGVKPVLYVNQMFVNKYLSQQADLKREYRVWIARYSEYKPDVRLTYWQLCPDGHVAGIHGEVDINVFNGYKRQFEEFLAAETIPQR